MTVKLWNCCCVEVWFSPPNKSVLVWLIGPSLQPSPVWTPSHVRPAISIEYYLAWPSRSLTVSHLCPRTDILITVPPTSSAVRTTTDTMIQPAVSENRTMSFSAAACMQRQWEVTAGIQDAATPGAHLSWHWQLVFQDVWNFICTTSRGCV